MKRYVLSILLLLSPICQADAPSISVDHVEGLYSTDTIFSDFNVKLHLKFEISAELGCLEIIQSGFRIYGENLTGDYDSTLTWTDLRLDTVNFDWELQFDALSTIFDFSVDNKGTDTIGYGGATFFNCTQVDFSDVGLILSFLIPSEHQGKTICIDNAMIPPGMLWLWKFDGVVIIPSWDGPHCFVIGPKCCRGQRGNVDHDMNEEINLLDLVFLVDFMFHDGMEIKCREEANIDGNGDIDISDLILLVSFLFSNGAQPSSCF